MSKSKEPTYRADTKYLEECTYLIVVYLLEQLPKVKLHIKKYLETFPS